MSREPQYPPEGLTRPSEPPTAPPPKHAPNQKVVVSFQNNPEAETASTRAQFAQMQNEIGQLREQLAAANVRIDELQQRLDSR